MFAQSLIEYSMVDALSSGLREFQIWLLDVRYTTWLIMGAIVLFVAFLWRFRPQR
jgi:hypothetical protein